MNKSEAVQVNKSGADANAVRIAHQEKRLERMVIAGNWLGVARAADAIYDLENQQRQV
jgi:hypothetical protein